MYVEKFHTTKYKSTCPRIYPTGWKVSPWWSRRLSRYLCESLKLCLKPTQTIQLNLVLLSAYVICNNYTYCWPIISLLWRRRWSSTLDGQADPWSRPRKVAEYWYRLVINTYRRLMFWTLGLYSRSAGVRVIVEDSSLGIFLPLRLRLE
jgi:hypothetical protein